MAVNVYYTANLPPLRSVFGAELACRREHLYDLTELEEALMIRTRYVELEPHWRAHRRFQRFLSAADTREELLFCTDWLRQHESVDDAETLGAAVRVAHVAPHAVLRRVGQEGLEVAVAGFFDIVHVD